MLGGYKVQSSISVYLTQFCCTLYVVLPTSEMRFDQSHFNFLSHLAFALIITFALVIQYVQRSLENLLRDNQGEDEWGQDSDVCREWRGVTHRRDGNLCDERDHNLYFAGGLLCLYHWKLPPRLACGAFSEERSRVQGLVLHTPRLEWRP